MLKKASKENLPKEREYYLKKRIRNRIVAIWVMMLAASVLVWFGDALIDRIFFYEESYEEIAVTGVSAFEIYFRLFLILLVGIVGIVLTRRAVEKEKSIDLIEFEREQTLRIFDSIDEQIYIIDPNSREVLYKNKKVGDIFGESEGKKCNEYFSTHGGDCSKCSMKELMEGDYEMVKSREYYNSKADRWYHGIEKKMKWIDGRDAVYTMLIDITDRKRTEMEAYRASKLETLEVMSGTIVHDFNNVLTTVMMSISLAKHLAEQDSKIASILSMAEVATYRAKDITHQLITFGKSVETELKHTHIEKLVRETVEFICRGSGIKHEVVSERNLPLVKVDVTQITQAINNILINAKQAMGEHGELKVSLASCEITANDRLPLKEGKYLKIEIADNGAGISSSVIHKIFDPYFTTKKEGSGLGLASAYMIMNRHQGYIRVESLEGKGTTFFLYLPASDERRQMKEKAEEAVVHNPVSGIILDDDAMLANVTAMIMNYFGHKMESADSVERAEEILKKKDFAEKAERVAILDNTLPGGENPVNAMERLKMACPECKFVLLMSVENRAIEHDFLSHGFDLVIAKPVKPENLMKEIESTFKK